MSVTRSGKMMEMKKYCIVSALLLGLSFCANAHEIPSFKANNESHTATSDFHQWVLANQPDLHWHFGDDEAGGWEHCVADAYDPCERCLQSN